MTAYRRPFEVTDHDDGLLITAGNRSLRLSRSEVDELVLHLTGKPPILRFATLG